MFSPERQSARMSKITNDLTVSAGHRMLYSCTHMATVGVKGLKVKFGYYWQTFAHVVALLAN